MLFFLIVGRLAFDSFKELFGELLYLFTPMGFLNLVFNYRETEKHQVKVLLVLVFSIIFFAFVSIQPYVR